jgi:CRISPR-associated protein Cmr6
MALKFVESTKAFRPASKAVNNALGGLPSGPFNFGLYFNKWMYVVGFEQNDGRKRGTPLACPISDETKQKDGKGDNITLCRPNMLLDNLDVSLALFNGLDGYSRVEQQEKSGKAQPVRTSYTLNAKWSRNTADALLKSKHAALDKSAEAYRLVGYEVMKCQARLLSSLVIGLGNEHPTEKGFRFDWNLGVPFVPATGLKGVVRLAFLVNRLNELDEAKAKAFWTRITDGLLEDDARELFGCDEDRKHNQQDQRGGIIFFDAYPEELPRLEPEIMNCHYPDYLNKKAERGPTEDQQPNPQKYWAISPWLDNERHKPLYFIFRMLVPTEIASSENGEKLQLALKETLSVHGLGAKTAVGHGKFEMHSKRSFGQKTDGNQYNESHKAVISTVHKTQDHRSAEAVSVAERLLKELALIKPSEMGRLGTIIQKIETLPTPQDKGLIAAAIREKLGSKVFKGHKRKDYLLSLIQAAGIDL